MAKRFTLVSAIVAVTAEWAVWGVKGREDDAKTTQGYKFKQ